MKSSKGVLVWGAVVSLVILPGRVGVTVSSSGGKRSFGEEVVWERKVVVSSGEGIVWGDGVNWGVNRSFGKVVKGKTVAPGSCVNCLGNGVMAPSPTCVLVLIICESPGTCVAPTLLVLILPM